MPEEKKLVARVQAMLNKAEATDNEAEAQTYREAAHRIMEKYSLDEAMAAHTKLAQGVDDKPETRPFEFADSFSPLISEMFSLMCSVAEHNKCMFVGFFSGRGHIVGYETDIDYVEMMYSAIRLQLLDRVDPKPNPNESYDSNVYRLHEAGIKWESIAHLMNKTKYNAPYGTLAESWEETPWVVDGRGQGKKDGGRLVRAAKRYCRENDLEYVAIADPKKFRRSYAEGFVAEIRTRLYRLDAVGKEVRSGAGKAGEVALFGRKERVAAAMEELEMLLGIHKSQTEKADKGKKPKKVAYPKTDYSAYDRGRADGKRADLGRRAGDIGDGRKTALEG